MCFEQLRNLFLENPLGQTIGLIAFILGVIAFLHKKDKKLYIWIMIAQLFWLVHFLFMGLYVGAFVNIIGLLRSFVALKYKHIKKFIFVFIFFYLLIGIFKCNNFIGILPILAGILGTLAFLYFSGLKGRIILLICSTLWLIYNYVGNSIGGVITEVFMIIAGLITIFRLIKSKNKI